MFSFIEASLNGEAIHIHDSKNAGDTVSKLTDNTDDTAADDKRLLAIHIGLLDIESEFGDMRIPLRMINSVEDIENIVIVISVLANELIKESMAIDAVPALASAFETKTAKSVDCLAAHKCEDANHIHLAINLG